MVDGPTMGWVLQTNTTNFDRIELADTGMTGEDQQLWTWSETGDLLINKYTKTPLATGCSAWEFAQKNRNKRWRKKMLKKGKTVDEITIIRCKSGGALDSWAAQTNGNVATAANANGGPRQMFKIYQEDKTTVTGFPITA